MDANEFYTEFNLAYNNLASNQAAGLDKVEISIYLTKAENILTDAIYKEFEKSEEARRKLAKLVITAKLNTVSIPEANILYPEYTATYQPLTDVRYIVSEQLKMSKNANDCAREQYIEVQPILLDEIHNIVKNPYKFNTRRALRLDTSYNNNNYIEILTKDKEHIAYYQIRYVKNPEPIMIYTSAEYTDTIDGYAPTTTPRLGSLPETTHRQIVEIAAKLAYADYKQ